MLKKHAFNWYFLELSPFTLDVSVKKSCCENEESDEDAEDESEDEEKSVHNLFCDYFLEASWLYIRSSAGKLQAAPAGNKDLRQMC